jgi:hypothetical protein
MGGISVHHIVWFSLSYSWPASVIVCSGARCDYDAAFVVPVACVVVPTRACDLARCEQQAVILRALLLLICILVLIADVLTSLLLRTQAAAEYLLKCGLEGLKGVVYLDEMDRQMVLLRKGLKVVKLADSGLAWNERFTFYDQVCRVLWLPRLYAACVLCAVCCVLCGAVRCCVRCAVCGVRCAESTRLHRDACQWKRRAIRIRRLCPGCTLGLPGSAAEASHFVDFLHC